LKVHTFEYEKYEENSSFNKLNTCLGFIYKVF